MLHYATCTTTLILQNIPIPCFCYFGSSMHKSLTSCYFTLNTLSNTYTYHTSLIKHFFQVLHRLHFSVTDFTTTNFPDFCKIVLFIVQKNACCCTTLHAQLQSCFKDTQLEFLVLFRHSMQKSHLLVTFTSLKFLQLTFTVFAFRGCRLWISCSLCRRIHVAAKNTTCTTTIGRKAACYVALEIQCRNLSHGGCTQKHYTYHLSIASFIPNQETFIPITVVIADLIWHSSFKMKNLAISILSKGLVRQHSLDTSVLHNYKHRSQ